MIESTNRYIHYFQFPSIAERDELRHAITGRHADPRRHPRGLNLSFATAEHSSDVVTAREHLCDALGLRLSDFVVPHQIHGTRVAFVGKQDRGRGAFRSDDAIPDCDALITDQPGVVLLVSAADCVPLLFYDPIRHSIGVAHAGWRGTLARIASKVVAALSQHCGSNPADLRVGIGPSIGPCCYAVGKEVIHATQAAFPNDRSLLVHRSNRSYLDLWEANRIALQTAGVLPDRIQNAGLCTACHTDLFFSHRAEQGNAGRFAAIIALLEGKA